jgi:hypothetical protein
MTIATVVLLFILVSGGYSDDARLSHIEAQEKGHLLSLVAHKGIHQKDDLWLPTYHYDEGRLFLLDRHYRKQQQRSLQENTYDDCLICGENKRVTSADATVDVPTEGGSIMTMTCEELEQYGNIGNISSILCPLIQPLVQDVCGCEEMETQSPSSVPANSMEPLQPVTTTTTTPTTTATTNTPINSGGTMPSTFFSLMWGLATVVLSILVTAVDPPSFNT